MWILEGEIPGFSYFSLSSMHLYYEQLAINVSLLGFHVIHDTNFLESLTSAPLSRLKLYGDEIFGHH
jgi:hypothetical protein